MVVLLLHTHMYSSTVYALHALVCLYSLSPLSNKPFLLSHKTLQKMKNFIP